MDKYNKNISTTFIPTINSSDEIKRIVSQILTDEGYALKKQNKEPVWRLGNGWLVAPAFFKVGLENNSVRIDSWIMNALLPGVYIGKSSLDNNFGFLAKTKPRRVLKRLIDALIVENESASGYIPREKK